MVKLQRGAVTWTKGEIRLDSEVASTRRGINSESKMVRIKSFTTSKNHLVLRTRGSKA